MWLRCGALGYLLVATPVGAATPCPPAAFTIDTADRPAVAAVIGGPVEQIVVAGDHVAVSSCDLPAKIKGKRSRTIVKAKGGPCGATRKLRVKVKMPFPACDVLTASIRGKRTGRARFTAWIVSPASTTTTTASTTTSIESTTTSTSLPNVPPAADLIDAAYDEGRIDYPTSLTYRAWALFGDPRLPPELDGSGAGGEDALFFHEVREAWPGLSPETQALLEPYLVRPTDPRSIYARPPVGSGSPATLILEPGDQPIDGCSGSWIGIGPPAGKFWVWYCDAFPNDGSRAAEASGYAEALYAPMTAAMGTPPADLPADEPLASENRIDVYVVDAGGCRLRDGECEKLSAADGLAVPALPYEDNGAGGTREATYLMINRDLSGLALESTVAHEFFHLLQAGLNVDGWGVNVSSHPDRPDYENTWLIDAGATWAEWAFVPLAAPSEVHSRFTANFQQRARSLQSNAGTDEYASYIWLYFMQQERAGANDPAGQRAVADIWREGMGAQTPQDWDDAADGLLPFATRFRDFAIRNINTTWLRDEGPVAILYDDLDTKFPVNEPPQALAVSPKEIGVGKVTASAVSLPPLTASYSQIAPAGIRHLKIDMSHSGPADRFDLDVLASIDEQFERFSPSDHQIEFCRDLPEEDLLFAYLVFSNHAKRPLEALRLEGFIEGKAACPFARQWSGDVATELLLDFAGTESRLGGSGTVQLAYDPVQSDPAGGFLVYGIVEASGTASASGTLGPCTYSGSAPFAGATGSLVLSGVGDTEGEAFYSMYVELRPSGITVTYSCPEDTPPPDVSPGPVLSASGTVSSLAPLGESRAVIIGSTPGSSLGVPEQSWDLTGFDFSVDR